MNVNRSGCVVLNNENNSLKWQVVDCENNESRFVCSTPVEAQISRRKRHLVHRPDHDPHSFIHPKQEYEFLFEDVDPRLFFQP